MSWDSVAVVTGILDMFTLQGVLSRFYLRMKLERFWLTPDSLLSCPQRVWNNKVGSNNIRIYFCNYLYLYSSSLAHLACADRRLSHSTAELSDISLQWQKTLETLSNSKVVSYLGSSTIEIAFTLLNFFFCV